MENKYPSTLINIHLPDEPMTATRSYCLRQLSETQWATAYYNEDQDSFYYGHYFTNIDDAYVEFRTELNRNLSHYEHLITQYYKYQHLINRQK